MKPLKKAIGTLFSTRAAGLYMLLFAAAIGIGTFIENDFGTSSAQHVVYKSWWFSLLLLLFGVSIVVNVFRFRMIPQKKWALLTFHLAMVVILIGAALTRYLGYEGIMHIREEGTSNIILSSETYLQLSMLKDGEKYEVAEPVLFSSLGNNHWQESWLLGNDLIELEVEEFIPNPIRKLVDDPNGKPTIKVVFGSVNGREEYYLQAGETRRINQLLFNFSKETLAGAINISLRNDQPYLQSDQRLLRTTMATRLRDTITAGESQPLALRALYDNGRASFVFGDYNPSAVVELSSEDQKVRNESLTALRVKAGVNGTSEELVVYGKKGLPGRPAITRLDNLDLAVSYGAKEISLPFSIKLYDFIMDKYPGTNSAASYASEVQLIDESIGLREDHRIYMNHVLDYKGFRFFQSSYDRDEKGTYLSVNHDFWGTWISYLGYALLTLGMVFTLFSKKSRFRQISASLKKMRARDVAVLFLAVTLIPLTSFGQKVIQPSYLTNEIDEGHAQAFSELAVQDYRGRMKPVHTLSREVLRKVSGFEQFEGLNADQVMLAMFANSREWLRAPLVKLGKGEKLGKLIGVDAKRAAYADFFDEEGSYILRDEVARANGLQPIDRGTYEKQLIKVDERVNILNLAFTGGLLRLIPLENDPNNTWIANGHQHNSSASNPVAEKFFTTYRQALHNGLEHSDYGLANTLVRELKDYQSEYGAAVVPSDTSLKAEILLNNLNVFNRLAATYALLAVSFLILLFISVFKPQARLSVIFKVLLAVLILAFVFHTTGLGLRWFVSGRAPWSNGYESMIYIGWTTVLAGILFSRKSFGGLAATMTLSATVLLVAMLSYLDPEITPLVPVLRSYWLSIHVSLEAGSYGFLMLGAVIGLINLVLMIFSNSSNEERVSRMIKEMTYLSEMTLIGGLFMISIGTYLGGVWANESWGRYWGWDAKETWALVTILIYAFILHMRLIPKMNGLFAFNFASIFGLGSVIMTYYGVNYYLSGLHSYAAGDPVPIPNWVYISVASVFVISILAYWKKRRSRLIS